MGHGAHMVRGGWGVEHNGRARGGSMGSVIGDTFSGAGLVQVVHRATLCKKWRSAKLTPEGEKGCWYADHRWLN